MLYDLHSHSTLSDGTFAPMEMIRQAVANGETAFALTDHATSADIERILPEIIKVCELARTYWNILAIPGVELTHEPALKIAETARRAKEMGAWIVVVHGETIVEPVEKGTDLAAIKSPHVDILAHPGLITPEEAELAARNGKILEISARKGHSLTNGHVAKLAQKAGVRLVVNSDAHKDTEILTTAFAAAVAQGAGLDAEACHQALFVNPEDLVKKIVEGRSHRAV
jgi:histidinol phosphatase-like PHP family hydrolase